MVRTVARSPWTAEDHALLLALDLYQSEHACPDCGEPKALAHHPDNDGWYEVDDSTVCNSCAALERWRDEHQGKNAPPPGTKARLTHDRDYTTHPLPAHRGYARPATRGGEG